MAICPPAPIPNPDLPTPAAISINSPDLHHPRITTNSYLPSIPTTIRVIFLFNFHHFPPALKPLISSKSAIHERCYTCRSTALLLELDGIDPTDELFWSCCNVVLVLQRCFVLNQPQAGYVAVAFHPLRCFAAAAAASVTDALLDEVLLLLFYLIVAAGTKGHAAPPVILVLQHS